MSDHTSARMGVSHGIALFSLNEKTAVITGSAGGIGLATARRLRAAGANVMMSDLTEASEAASEIGAHFVKADISDEGQVEQLMQSAVDQFGSLDIVVNNAGIMTGAKSLLEESVETIRKQFEINTLGTLYGIRAAARRMTEGGAIVNTGSLVCFRSVGGWGGYAVSKAPIPVITRQAAVELGEKGIRVNAICPSTTDTAMGLPSDFVVLSSQFKRIAKPDEIAAVVHFLASPDASWVNGQTIGVDGGMLAGPNPELVGVVNSRAKKIE